MFSKQTPIATVDLHLFMIYSTNHWYFLQQQRQQKQNIYLQIKKHKKKLKLKSPIEHNLWFWVGFFGEEMAVDSEKSG